MLKKIEKALEKNPGGKLLVILFVAFVVIGTAFVEVIKIPYYCLRLLFDIIE